MANTSDDDKIVDLQGLMDSLGVISSSSAPTPLKLLQILELTRKTNLDPASDTLSKLVNAKARSDLANYNPDKDPSLIGTAATSSTPSNKATSDPTQDLTATDSVSSSYDTSNLTSSYEGQIDLGAFLQLA